MIWPVSNCSSRAGRVSGGWRQVRHPGDLPLLLRIFAFAMATRLLARLGPARLAGLLEPRRPVPVPTPPAVDRIAAYVDKILAAGRPLVPRGCLARGLTRYYFLRRAGLAISLCFGIGLIDGEPAGHCWLVREGEPFLEREDPRAAFVEVMRFPLEGPPLAPPRSRAGVPRG